MARPQPGARIVSQYFKIPGIKPDQELTVESNEGGEPGEGGLWPVSQGRQLLKNWAPPCSTNGHVA